MTLKYVDLVTCLACSDGGGLRVAIKFVVFVYESGGPVDRPSHESHKNVEIFLKPLLLVRSACFS